MPTPSTRNAWNGSCVAVTQPGRERRRPEAIAGPREAHARVGRVLARIQADEQHAHARADGVGEHARSRRLDVDPLFAVVDERIDVEARALDDVAQPRRRPPREVASGEPVVGVLVSADPT